MKQTIWTLVFFTFTLSSLAQSKKILFKTNKGDFKVLLYDFTPAHQQLMLNAITDSVYHKALFNRVIQNFVVQGGEHDRDIERAEHENPLAVKKRLASEFTEKAYHKIGALGAGRDDNPEKASFLNQIYFVVGKKVTREDLQKLELKKGIKYTKRQRKTYLKHGGLPRLDKDYTVFREVYEGLDVLMRISKAQTDSLDYPTEPIVFEIELIKK